MDKIKILGFISPVAKDRDDFDDSEIFGQEIKGNNNLFSTLNEIYDKSSKECDIQIRFISQSMNQDNEVRNQIKIIVNKFTKTNCIPLVRSLALLTDHKTKEGLVFFIVGIVNNATRLLITRFPSETGITVQQNNGYLNFTVIDKVFLKNSRKYKAVYYDSTDDYWIGNAVDKQINDTAGKVKEISDYWIKDFLQSELKINSKRGTSILAKAVRKTITETDDENIKSELIGATQVMKNINARMVSMESFFSTLNLSESTKREVLSKIDNSSIYNISFQFDSEEFEHNCNYLVNILDSGAVIMAPSSEFNDVWQKESVAEGGVYRYSTQGKTIKEKISNRV